MREPRTSRLSTQSIANILDVQQQDLAEYKGDPDIDEALVEALIRTAQLVAEKVTTLGPVKLP